MLKSTATKWRKVTLTNWYGHSQKEMEIATATALWYHRGKPVVPLKWVLLRDPEGKLAPVALLSTDLELPAEMVVVYFARRWSLEVKLEETQAHLGVETQRQWSEKAVERTTPVLLGLFSIVKLLAERVHQQGMLLEDEATWYKKEKPTFRDAVAAVRRLLWQKIDFSTSDIHTEMVKIPQPLLHQFQHRLANAA
ncbi:hypothetical protein [Pontibacter qinzhouensis]|uniref:hypothetical protein n=1 Tax=Pontibacter qinzhouensis TaxID=2603253 RepID=UPI001C9CFCCC|nr:hypothetical protein [Pontibacter qinzhouensis]